MTGNSTRAVGDGDGSDGRGGSMRSDWARYGLPYGGNVSNISSWGAEGWADMQVRPALAACISDLTPNSFLYIPCCCSRNGLGVR